MFVPQMVAEGAGWSNHCQVNRKQARINQQPASNKCKTVGTSFEAARESTSLPRVCRHSSFFATVGNSAILHNGTSGIGCLLDNKTVNVQAGIDHARLSWDSACRFGIVAHV